MNHHHRLSNYFTYFFTYFFCFTLFITLNTAIVQAKTVPELLLAKRYKKSTTIDITHYLVSEKLDGVRAYWDGKQLLSRQGNRIYAPKWFTEHFPKQPLDGELWIARHRFQQTVSTVRKQQPIDAEWQQVSYQLFELPNAKGTFQQRVIAMETLVNKLNIPHLKVIQQYRLPSIDALHKKLDEVVAQGAEGLMLHRANALYHTGRSGTLLKVKKHQYAQARVIRHIAGTGKWKNRLKSIVVETKEGLRFKIGTGFSTQERENPPAIGSVVRYKYLGHTQKGLPRFASFIQVQVQAKENATTTAH